MNELFRNTFTWALIAFGFFFSYVYGYVAGLKNNKIGTIPPPPDQLKRHNPEPVAFMNPDPEIDQVVTARIRPLFGHYIKHCTIPLYTEQPDQSAQIAELKLACESAYEEITELKNSRLEGTDFAMDCLKETIKEQIDKIDDLERQKNSLRKSTVEAWQQANKWEKRFFRYHYALGKTQTRLREAERDTARLDWLADKNNTIGNVQLPAECVLKNLTSLRDAIDYAMNIDTSERFCKSNQ